MSIKKENFLTSNESLFLTLARVLDAFSGFALFWLIIRFQMTGQDSLQIFRVGMIIFGFILIFFHFQNIYRSFRFSTLRYEIRTIFSACFFLFAVLGVMGYLLDIFVHFSKAGIIAWMVLWPIFIALMRIAFRKWVRFIRIKGHNLKKAVIVGQSMAGAKLAEHIYKNPWTGTKILGFFEDSEGENDCKIKQIMPQVNCLGNVNSLVEYTKKNKVDIIYIALNGNDEKSMLKLVKAIEMLPVAIYCVPNVFFLDLIISGDVIFFDQSPIIVLKNTPIQGIPGVAKRGMDILFSFLSIVLLSPLFILIGAMVKITSEGPVFFTQSRYGVNGEEIKIYKFRTMYDHKDLPDSTYVQATKKDARITPLGRFLRRTSLDELPQLINVIQGRMSLVGPRPHPVAMDEQYRKIIAGYMIRHKVKPGITGLAQVKGFRGETETLEKMEKRIECDLRYIREWSILYDIEIMIRTVIVLFFQKNAY